MSFVIKKRFGNTTADFSVSNVKVSAKTNNIKLSAGAYDKMGFNVDRGDRIDLVEGEVEVATGKSKSKNVQVVTKLALVHIVGDLPRFDSKGNEMSDEEGNQLITNEGRKVSSKGLFSSGSIASKLGHGKTYKVDIDNPQHEGDYTIFLLESTNPDDDDQDDDLDLDDDVEFEEVPEEEMEEA